MERLKDKIKEKDINVGDLEIYRMEKVQLGMIVDNQPTPIYIKHKPTNKYVICKEHKLILKNLYKAVNMIEDKINKG